MSYVSTTCKPIDSSVPSAISFSSLVYSDSWKCQKLLVPRLIEGSAVSGAHTEMIPSLLVLTGVCLKGSCDGCQGAVICTKVISSCYC